MAGVGWVGHRPILGTVCCLCVLPSIASGGALAGLDLCVVPVCFLFKGSAFVHADCVFAAQGIQLVLVIAFDWPEPDLSAILNVVASATGFVRMLVFSPERSPSRFLPKVPLNHHLWPFSRGPKTPSCLSLAQRRVSNLCLRVCVCVRVWCSSCRFHVRARYVSRQNQAKRAPVAPKKAVVVDDDDPFRVSGGCGTSSFSCSVLSLSLSRHFVFFLGQVS